MWEVATGKRVRELKVAKHFLVPLALHPDGKTLAVGEADGRIGLWDLESRERKKTLRGHTEYLH